MNNNTKYPILYSFRRCPYAIRTRMVIKSAKIIVELREIKLNDKPKDFLEISPKGTVPVLITNSGQVLEESLDIIYWALRINDPNNLLSEYNLSKKKIDELLKKLEDEFKPNLDRYKYEGVDVVHDLEKFPYPFPDNHFDYIYARGSIEHLGDFLGTIKEIHRILKPNGTVYIYVPHFSGSGSFLQFLFRCQNWSNTFSLHFGPKKRFFPPF